MLTLSIDLFHLLARALSFICTHTERERERESMDTEIMSGNEHTTNLEDGLEMVKRTRQDSVGGENHTIIQVDDPVHGTGDTHTTSEVLSLSFCLLHKL